MIWEGRHTHALIHIPGTEPVILWRRKWFKELVVSVVRNDVVDIWEPLVSEITLLVVPVVFDPLYRTIQVFNQVTNEWEDLSALDALTTAPLTGVKITHPLSCAPHSLDLRGEQSGEEGILRLDLPSGDACMQQAVQVRRIPLLEFRHLSGGSTESPLELVWHPGSEIPDAKAGMLTSLVGIPTGTFIVPV